MGDFANTFRAHPRGSCWPVPHFDKLMVLFLGKFTSGVDTFSLAELAGSSQLLQKVPHNTPSPLSSPHTSHSGKHRRHSQAGLSWSPSCLLTSCVAVVCPLSAPSLGPTSHLGRTPPAWQVAVGTSHHARLWQVAHSRCSISGNYSFKEKCGFSSPQSPLIELHGLGTKNRKSPTK